MKRMLASIAFAIAVLTSSLALAADKPVVVVSGQMKQLPANHTLQLNGSGTGAASINIPHGTAPTSPNDGDCWTTSAGFYCRITGATVGPYGTGSGSSITAKDEGSTLTSGVTSLDFTGAGVTATNTGGAVTVNVTGGGGGGTTTNALTIAGSGGASPGATFDGSVARTIDYSTVGAAKTGAVTGSNLTMATGKLLGRSTASTGAIEEITVGSGLTLSGGTLSASGGGGSTPTIRAATITSSSTNSYTLTWPSGTVSGDVEVLFGGHGFGINLPSGWTQLDNSQGSNFNGAVFVKVLTSGDITTGSVTVTTAGVFNGVFSLVTLDGSTVSGIRSPSSFIRDGTGASTSALVSTTPVSTDRIITFISNRGTSTDTFSAGITSLQSVNASSASGAVGYFSGTLGKLGVSETASYSSAGSGFYTAIVSFR